MSESTDRRQNWFGAIVTILCIGILWALLMPAVQTGGGRSSARRTQCRNNLKNLTLATLNFETTKEVYPGYQALYGSPSNTVLQTEPGKIGSWVVALLPMLEQQALRDFWDDPAFNDDWVEAVRDGNKGASELFYPSLGILRCPSDTMLDREFAGTSYAPNAGFHLMPRDPVMALEWYASAADASERSTISQRSANSLFVNRLGSAVIDPTTGQLAQVFGSGQAVNSADVKDGTSQTISFTENCNNLSWADFSITDESARSKVGIVWLYAGDSASEGRPQPLLVTSTMKINDRKMFVGSGPTRARPSAMHPAVVNVAMADGSIRTIDESIDYHVYQSLMAPHDASSDIPDLRYKLKADDF